MKRSYLLTAACAIVLAVVFSVGFYFNSLGLDKYVSTSKASSINYLLNTKTKWDEGSLNNITSTAGGTIGIGSAATQPIPLDSSMLSADSSLACLNDILVNDGAYWNSDYCGGVLNWPTDPYFKIDLGQASQISRFYMIYLTDFLGSYSNRHIIISYSSNDSDYAQMLFLNNASSEFHSG